MMKISTQLMFDRGSAQMSTVQNKLTQTQAQLAQGKQVINASDAPNQAARPFSDCNLF
jgi:flagellar hook-associated protein 3 FlgL